MEEGMAIENRFISRGIDRAQKKVEERNFSIRKNVLEYDEVMDYQRQVFYHRRQQILDGRNLDRVIWPMIEETVEQAVATFMDPMYPAQCAAEWARSSFGVSVPPEKLDMDSLEGLEERFRDAARDEARSSISLTIGEYLDPDIERKDWDYRGLAKWAMSRFNVSLSLSQLMKEEPEEIEEKLTQAALEKIEAFDFTPLNRCLDENYAKSSLVDWVKNKFAIAIRLQDILDKNQDAIQKIILDQVLADFHRREVEFPVDFALTNTLLSQDSSDSAYAAAALVEWVNQKYNANWTLESLANKDINQIRREIVQLAESYLDNGKLDEEIDTTLSNYDGNRAELTQWAKKRFHVELDGEDLSRDELRERIFTQARSFLRGEMTRLEEYILLNIYDSVWKEHLLNMDHLKDTIGLRGYAEKDPKIEYKREGTQMFYRMLDSIREQVTDLILKVQVSSGGLQTRSVWQNQQAHHNEASGLFTEQDRQAAMQNQGVAQETKTIKRDKPKVGPNDPCVCGSGKKFKKCCGKHA